MQQTTGVLRKLPPPDKLSIYPDDMAGQRSKNPGHHVVHSASSDTGTDDSDCSVVQQQVRQVMVDLVTVLGELRTVVGDIKTLVTQIDVVTHKIDESVSSGDEGKRRASDTEVEQSSRSKELVKQRPVSYHSEPIGTAKKNDHHGKTLLVPPNTNYLKLSKSTTNSGKTNTNVRSNDIRSPHKHDYNQAEHYFVKTSKSAAPKRDLNHNAPIPYGSTKTTDQHPNYVNVNPQVARDRINRNSIAQKWMGSTLESSLGSSTVSDNNCETDSRVKWNKKGRNSKLNYIDVNPQSESSTGPTEYSGLYEREMEDCLEFEISESLDLLDPANEAQSIVSDSGQEESDDYVNWGRHQLEAARKQAQVMAWTRSSWAGHELYHVSLDNSVAYSDDATDGEADTDVEGNTKKWEPFLPMTMNQHVVNYSWRTVVEP